MPGDPHTAVALRRILAIDGDTQVRVFLDPRAGFGRHQATRISHGGSAGGVWTARCGPLYLRWSGADDGDAAAGGGLQTVITVPAGGHHDLVLEISDRRLERRTCRTRPRPGKGPARPGTRRCPKLSGTIADRDARHAYAVMRGLTSSAGGMVAAATMSLPERAEEGRNYDYRYAWIRDQCFSGQAVAAAGPLPAAGQRGRVRHRADLADGPQLKPAYTVGGGPVPDERRLHLPGYPGGSDKVGNWVNQQFQLDAFGEALLLLAAAAGHDRLDREHWRAAEAAVAAIKERGGEPDAGIWELDDQRWTHSRLTCVAGLRAIAAVAPAEPGRGLERAGRRAAGRRHGRLPAPVGPLAAGPGDDQRIDAALLLPAIRGAIPAGDPRTLATLEAAERSWARTATCTATGRTSGRWVRPRARSCSAASPSRWPCTSRAGRSRPPAGLSATGPPAGHPACSPRSTT